MKKIVSFTLIFAMAFSISVSFVFAKNENNKGNSSKSEKIKELKNFEKANNSKSNAKIYKDLIALQNETDYFCDIHNNTHHYSTQRGMTPVKCMKHLNYPIRLLDNKYQVTDIPKEVDTGEIHVIRFIRSDLKFNLFNLQCIKLF